MERMPENIVRLLAYWNGLAGGGTPDRGQFHIEDLQPLLPFLMLCELEAQPFRVRYRVSGTRVDEMTGMNLAGRYLDEFLGSDYDKAVREMLGYYEAVSRSGEPLIFNYPWAGDNPKQKLIWVGLFPLKVDGAVSQCVAIEDYGAFNEREDGRLELSESSAKRDWAHFHKPDVLRKSA